MSCSVRKEKDTSLSSNFGPPMAPSGWVQCKDHLERAALESRTIAAGQGGGHSFVWQEGWPTCSPDSHLPTDAHLLVASALRTPLSISSSYAAPFAMMSHHEMNGSLTSPSAYAGLHSIPPQMSAAAAAAAAAYGRSPMVSFGAVRRSFGSFLGDWAGGRELVGVGV
jgi:hypothetical protein